MKKINFWSIFMMAMLMLGAVLSLSSCGDDSDPDEVSVSMPSVNFSENGGSQVVQITSNTGWTVSGAQSWLTVAPVSGSKNGSISLMASANTESSSRSCVLYVNAGSASAVITVTQSAVSAPTRVTITNGSVYTLERFRVVFLNSRFEKLTDRDFGTLSPGGSVTVDIPTGATEYYMATYSGSTWYFSPNYTVDYTTLNLTTDEVGNWSANSAPIRKLSAATE